DFGPPGDEIQPALPCGCTVCHPLGKTECDVFGALLGDDHGIMTGLAGMNADDRTAAKGLARSAVAAFDVLAVLEVNAVGTQFPGKINVVQDQSGGPLGLSLLHERLGGCFSEALAGGRD